MRSIDDVRRELVEVADRGLKVDVIPQGRSSGRPPRRSAVLILFGALDRVPARPGLARSDSALLGSTGLARPAPARPVPARPAPAQPAPTSPAPVRSVPLELDVLLTRRADTMRHHPGQIAFPGGGVEPTDSGPDATALREAAEETDLDPTGVEVLGTLQELHIPVSDNLVTPVLGWWRLPSEVSADHHESVEVMRVPVAELLDPAARGTSELRRSTTVFRGPAFELGPQFGGHVVWGFTAMVLSELFTELGWEIPWDRTRTFEVRAPR